MSMEVDLRHHLWVYPDKGRKAKEDLYRYVKFFTLLLTVNSRIFRVSFDASFYVKNYPNFDVSLVWINILPKCWPSVTRLLTNLFQNHFDSATYIFSFKKIVSYWYYQNMHKMLNKIVYKKCPKSLKMRKMNDVLT